MNRLKLLHRFRDSVEVYATSTATLPLGTIDLNRNDYHGGGIVGPQTPSPSGPAAPPHHGPVALHRHRHPRTGSGTADTAGGTDTMGWEASATAYDAAGNLAS